MVLQGTAFIFGEARPGHRQCSPAFQSPDSHAVLGA